MGIGSSDLVRTVAAEKYVQPAILAGKTQFSVAVRDVMKDLQGRGFPAANYPQICTALKTGKFLKQNGLEIEGIDGPPSGLSTTVVVHYRVTGVQPRPAAKPGSGSPTVQDTPDTSMPAETSAAKAARLIGKLHGLLHEEYKEYGGADGFIRWVRGWDEDESGR